MQVFRTQRSRGEGRVAVLSLQANLTGSPTQRRAELFDTEGALLPCD